MYFEQFHLHEEIDEREVEVAVDWAYIRAHWIWTLTPKSGGEAFRLFDSRFRETKLTSVRSDTLAGSQFY